ncbi:MAG: hypothetical protein ACKPGB_11935, partial [Dolichospermum sp.]
HDTSNIISDSAASRHSDPHIAMYHIRPHHPTALRRAETYVIQSWADTFIKQWNDIEIAAQQVGCLDKLHIWPDPSLKGFVSEDKINNWLYRPTIEKWNSK